MYDRPFDDLAVTNNEAQRGSSVVAGVELAAVASQCSPVVDRDLVAFLALSLALHRLCDFDVDLVCGEDSGYQSGN